MDVKELLTHAVERGASDIFIVAGRPVSYRVNDIMIRDLEGKLMPEDTESVIRQIYELAQNRDIRHFEEDGDDDFAFAIQGLSRFRVSTYKQRGAMSAVIRVIGFSLPKPEEIGIPDSVIGFSKMTKGLVLVTGPAGSGKSTTLSCMIDEINEKCESHIITLEDPLEYLHTHKKSIVSQREVNVDTQNYVTALRAALRQSPNVILLGEMGNSETIDVAVTAAETGHLLLSTMHTIGAANTIDRMIDIFPPEQQHQIAVRLSYVLKAVISQQLVPAVDGNLVPVFEIMTVTPEIRNMIRENKTAQIDSVLYSAEATDMISMDTSLFQMVKQGRITKETAMLYAVNGEVLSRKLQMI